MKPATFEYHRAMSVPDAISLLQIYGEDAKIIAGGQSLIPMMNFRLARPSHLIDVGRLQDLNHLSVDSDRVTIGALTPHATVEHHPAICRDSSWELLRKAVSYIGHAPIRNRGTVGGSIAHADGVAEWPTLSVLLDGTITASGPTGVRTIPADEFFLGLYTTTLEPEEMVTELVLRKPTPFHAFEEVALRHGDFATASVGVVLTTVDGTVSDAKVVVAGATPVPRRLPAVERHLRGRSIDAPVSEESAGEVADAVATDVGEIDDEHRYVRVILPYMIIKAVTSAATRDRQVVPHAE